MATINGSTNDSKWTFKTEVTETGTNIQNKTSTLSVKVSLGRASTQAPVGGKYKLTINCGDQKQTYDGTISWPTYINGGSWLLLKTFTFNDVPNTGTKNNPTKVKITSTLSNTEFTPSSAKSEGEFTLTALHTEPSINSLSLTETNSQLVALTVSNSTIVQYLSKKTATIGVTTYDGASVTKCDIYHNNVIIGTSTSKTVTIDFSKVSELVNSGTNQIGLMVAVSDNQDGYSTKMFSFTVIKYTKPTMEATSTGIKRQTGDGVVLTQNKALLNFVGTCYKGSNVIGNNNKPKVEYKIWRTGASEPSYTALTTSNVANVTIKDYPLSNLDYTKPYTYKIKFTDSFTTTETTINFKIDKLPTGVSVWTEYKDRVDFLKITQGGTQVALEAEVLYDSTTGTNGNVTLSKSSANYSYLEIFYYNSEYRNMYGSIKVPSPNGKHINLQTINPYKEFNSDGTTKVARLHVLGSDYLISGSTITFVEGYGLAVNGESIYGVSSNTMKIVKVIGYKP